MNSDEIRKSRLNFILNNKERELIATWKGVFVTLIAVDQICFIFYFPKFGVDHTFLYVINFLSFFSFVGLFGLTIFNTISKLSFLQKNDFKSYFSYFLDRVFRYFPPLIFMIAVSFFLRFIILKFNLLGGDISFKLSIDLFSFRDKFFFTTSDALRTLRMEGAYFVNISSPSWTIYLGWWLTILTILVALLITNNKILIKSFCILLIYFIIHQYFNVDNYIYILVWILYSIYFMFLRLRIKDYIILLVSILIFSFVLIYNNFNYKNICNSNPILLAHLFLFIYLSFKIIKIDFFIKISKYSYLWFLIHSPIYLFIYSIFHSYFENSLIAIVLISTFAFFFSLYFSKLIYYLTKYFQSLVRTNV